METYKITLTFSNPYIGSRNGGNKTLSTNLTLKEAYKELLDLYNKYYADERGYAHNWGNAVRSSVKYIDGANKTFSDGTRRFEWDSRVFKIEEETEEEI